MRAMFPVAAVSLLLGGCASTLPEVIDAKDYPDIKSRVRLVRYQSVIGSYTNRVPTDPKPWRELNDAQAPKGGA